MLLVIVQSSFRKAERNGNNLGVKNQLQKVYPTTSYSLSLKYSVMLVENWNAEAFAKTYAPDPFYSLMALKCLIVRARP